jgi:hypothetical protein
MNKERSMQFFTTEMIFTHPPRTFAGHYASPRRRRYGCRTMPRIAAPATEARVEAQATQAIDAQASTDASAKAEATEVLIIDEAA